MVVTNRKWHSHIMLWTAHLPIGWSLCQSNLLTADKSFLALFPSNRVIPNSLPTETHQDAYIEGGVALWGVANAYSCVTTCRHLGDCVAVDFNTATGTCTVHRPDTGCGTLVDNFTAVNSIHFKLTDCRKWKLMAYNIVEWGINYKYMIKYILFISIIIIFY